jgi:hypothetical protein
LRNETHQSGADPTGGLNGYGGWGFIPADALTQHPNIDALRPEVIAITSDKRRHGMV